MLGLQVAAPLHLVVELVVVLLQDLDGVGIAHPAKIGGGHVPQPLHQPLVHEGVEEGHLVGALLHHIVDDVFDHGLGHVHVVRQIGERHLRLDHPELRRVALGVGVLRPEGGAEGIHAAERHGEVLRVELAGHREVGPLAEEILRPVHAPVLEPGRIGHVQGGHLEHLSSALAVAGRDDRGVHIDEPAVLEEAVDGVGRHRTHPEHCGEQIGAGAQVLDGAQILHAVALLLEGIVRRGRALHRDGSSLHFQGLFGLGREHHGAGDDQGGAHVLSGDLFVVVQDAGVHDHLEVLEAGAVVEFDEAEGLHVPDGLGPPHDGDGLSVEASAVGKDGGDGDAIHMRSLYSKN